MHRLQRWMQNTIAFVIEVVLLTLTGFFGSVYGAEIMKGTNLRGGAFMLGLFLFTVCYVGTRHWVILRLDRQLRDEMIRAIRTQPRTGILLQYQSFFRETFARYRSTLFLDISPEERVSYVLEIEKVIRDVLSEVCRLADAFNPLHADRKYAANIMLYLSLDDMAQGVRAALEHETKFLAHNQGLEKMCGVLRLIPALSCDNETEPNTPKASLRPIALPIPARVKEIAPSKEEHWFVLPGAPMAHVTFRPSQVFDTREVGKWCRERTSLDAELVERIEAYMIEAADKGRFRSFYSLPVPGRDWDREERVDRERSVGDVHARPIAILNVESVEPGLFLFEEPANDFAVFMEPFLLLLSEMIIKLLEIDPHYPISNLVDVDEEEKVNP